MKRILWHAEMQEEGLCVEKGIGLLRISRNTKRILLWVVRQRNRIVCENFILRNINTNCRVIIDLWRGYIRLREIGYNHSTINHQENFVDPNNSSTNTQKMKDSRKFSNQNPDTQFRLNI
jgi:hypothetical protein